MCGSWDSAEVVADQLGAFEVGQHQDTEQLGSRSQPEGIEAFTKPAV